MGDIITAKKEIDKFFYDYGTEINFQNNYCHVAQVSELGKHTGKHASVQTKKSKIIPTIKK